MTEYSDEAFVDDELKAPLYLEPTQPRDIVLGTALLVTKQYVCPKQRRGVCRWRQGATKTVENLKQTRDLVRGASPS